MARSQRKIAREHQEATKDRPSSVVELIADLARILDQSTFWPTVFVWAIVLSPFLLVGGVLLVILAVLVDRFSEALLSSFVLVTLGGVVGTTSTVLLSHLVLRSSQQRTHKTIEQETRKIEFVRTMAELEKVVREVAGEQLGASQRVGLGMAIDAVQSLRFWTDKDVSLYRRLLGIRNSLVHEGVLADDLDLDSACAEAGHLTDQLAPHHLSRPA